MRVVYLAAGAAGMYCGSCLHDNRLAATLRAQGRDVVLVPLYTPLRTDESDVSTRRVYFGGINVYLQQTAALFRHTPAFVDRLLDAPALLRSVGRFAAQTRPEVLGEFTLSVLQGEQGRQRKELQKLVAGLRALQPSLVHLPNLMFVGLAPALKTTLHVPVLCSLTGEDIFLDRLPEAYRRPAFKLIQERVGDIDGFVALTDYYARHATGHFGLPASRVHRVPMGIRAADFERPARPAARPFTIGYLARVCPEKGLAELVQAFIVLRQRARACRLRAAGYLGTADKPYLARILDALRAERWHDGFEYVGEVSRDQKLEFLQSLDVLSVPAAYPESKGFYVLEALAAGVPVVQPAHGSFPELITATGGGVLYEPGNVAALADALAGLMDDAPRRQQLAAQGRAAVHRDFTAERMAAEAWRLYERFV